ncbi:hypothetical protein OSH10_10975 [Kaistia defluvii]|uniref:hypothetical protein n=1 Tax=Kaistia defluvii TaxID=410841 RepID=UPI0022508425|nr:hypothetical protein [Kaistia defluvii]MCX5518961.1 hypothetical protein [Kaistia defluvii]
MPHTIGRFFAVLLLSGVAIPGVRAETAPPADPPAAGECPRTDRCVPTRDALDGKASQDRKLKTKHDTVKNSINNVR